MYFLNRAKHKEKCMKQILKQIYFISKSWQKINKNGNRIHETM